MPKRALQLKFPSIALDRRSKIPLSRQLYLALRNAILRRFFRSDDRLLSTRALAAKLGVSRNTVQTAYDQLSAEGYIAATIGSGTRVTRALPETYLRELLGTPPPIAGLSFRQILKQSFYPVRQARVRDSEGNDFYLFDSGHPTP